MLRLTSVVAGIVLLLAAGASGQSDTSQPVRVDTVVDTVVVHDATFLPVFLSATDSATILRDRSRSELSAGAGGFEVFWKQWGATAIGFLTAVILLLALLVSYSEYQDKTRPIIMFTLIWGNPSTLVLNPIIRNHSKTDAMCLVNVRIFVDNKPYPCETKVLAYSGGLVWLVPVMSFKEGIRGNLDLSPKLRELELIKGAGTLDSAQKGLYLEASVHYTKYKEPKHHLFSGWPYVFSRRIFSTPIQRWVWKSGRWILKPDFDSVPVPPKVRRSLFFSPRSSARVETPETLDASQTDSD